MLSYAILVAFIALYARLVWLQTVCCKRYRGQSRRNAIKRTELAAFRGTIRDRRGTPLAVDRPCFDIVVPYRLLVDTWALSLRDILDWSGLCQALNRAPAKPSRWPYRKVWESLTEDARTAVAHGAKSGRLPTEYQFDIVRALNELLKQRKLYLDEDLVNVPVPGQARVLLERKRYRLSRHDVRKLNRLLLWATHPQTIAAPRPHEHSGPWRDEALAVTFRSLGPEIDATVTRIIARVAALKAHLFKKSGRRFRIREEAVAHTVCTTLASMPWRGSVSIRSATRTSTSGSRPSDTTLTVTWPHTWSGTCRWSMRGSPRSTARSMTGSGRSDTARAT